MYILQDLIHGAPVGKAVANRCHVTMNYEDDDANMRAFTRLVTGSGSEYRVDGKVFHKVLDDLISFYRLHLLGYL